MILLTILWVVIIVLSVIAFIFAFKNGKYARFFSGLTVVISVLALIISSISGHKQQDEIIKTLSRQHDDTIVAINSGFDKTFEERLDERVDVIYKDDIFLVELEMRSEQYSTWKKVLDLNPGDEIEFQLHFKNNGYGIAENVMMRVSLPDAFTYIENSAMLYNASHPEGLHFNDPTIKAVNVGNYAIYGDAYLRFSVKMQDSSFKQGLTYRCITWAKVSAKGEALQDHTQVYVKMNNDS